MLDGKSNSGQLYGCCLHSGAAGDAHRPNTKIYLMDFRVVKNALTAISYLAEDIIWVAVHEERLV